MKNDERYIFQAFSPFSLPLDLSPRANVRTSCAIIHHVSLDQVIFSLISHHSHRKRSAARTANSTGGYPRAPGSRKCHWANLWQSAGRVRARARARDTVHTNISKSSRLRGSRTQDHQAGLGKRDQLPGVERGERGGLGESAVSKSQITLLRSVPLDGKWVGKGFGARKVHVTDCSSSNIRLDKRDTQVYGFEWRHGDVVCV